MNERVQSRQDTFAECHTPQEELTNEGLALIRVAKEQSDSYGQEMAYNSRRIQETCVSDGAQSYLEQRRTGARHELALFVDQLVREQATSLDEAERDLKARAEKEHDRRRREKERALWD